LLGNPVIHFFQFVIISFIGGIGLGLVFTFLAAIAAKAQQQSALMAIMGFPIVIPQLLLLGKISSKVFSDALQGGWWQMVLLLISLDVLIVLLSIILFPFLWKD
jgi:heme exporter protein B